MNEGELRKIAKEEMAKSIMDNLDSTLIFTYIKNLEKENKELQKENDIKDKVIDKLAQWVANSCPLIDKQTAKDIIYNEVKL